MDVVQLRGELEASAAGSCPSITRSRFQMRCPG
jgi:hypothetical protein